MNNYRICELTVSNIGPFTENSLIFPEKTDNEKAEIHILSGENGSGKTTILLLLASIENQQHLLKRCKTNNESSNYAIRFSDNTTFTAINNKGFRFDVNSPSVLGQYISKIRSNVGEYEFAFFAYSGWRRIQSETIVAISELKALPLTGALDFDYTNSSEGITQWIANQITKEALSLAKNDKIKAKAYRDSINRIENCISQIINQDISFEINDNPLQVVIKLNNQTIEFDVLPDGLKSLISWISDLLMRLDRCKWRTNESVTDRCFILFLDEIDIHLHPSWQRQVLPAIQNLFRNAQIFVSTHSPFVVGSISGAWIHKISSEGSKRTIETSLSQAAKSYTLILNETFDTPYYFGLEIETLLARFRTLRDKVLSSNNPSADDVEQLKRCIEKLRSQKSVVLDNMIGMEIKQLYRTSQINLSTTL